MCKQKSQIFKLLSVHICLYAYIKLTALFVRTPAPICFIEPWAWASDRGLML